MFNERFENGLKIQKKTGLLREPVEITKREGKYIFLDSKKMINFSSNDYLGLGTSKELKTKVAKNFLRYGTSSSSSRLVSGNYSLISIAEKEYAQFFGYDDALFFPSGYQANIGILSALFDQKDSIIFDKHIHASSVKGLELSHATFYGYNHNQMAHLEKRLKKAKKNISVVVTESLFSMDGDFLNISGFEKLKNEYGFFSIVDEAHAFGAIGKKGEGIAYDVSDIAIGTFGKALGFLGAFVLLPKEAKQFLFNFSSPFIYTTALPEAHAASAMDILSIIKKSDDKRKHLSWISKFMKESLKNEGFKVDGDAHILAIFMGGENRAVYVSNQLLGKNIFVFPARYPTVPEGKAILRIGMTSMHTEDDVKYFVEQIKEVCTYFAL